MFSYLSVFAKDISLSHSIFALPFMFCGILLGEADKITYLQVLLLVFAMIFARSFAMGMNRFLDAEIDKKNQRTKNRAIPQGEIGAGTVLIFSIFSALFFIVVSFQFNNLTGYCAVPILVILASYSLMKKYFWGCHWYLGCCLGLAPIAAQIALTGQANLPVLLLGLSVAFWTAGFDILYAIQDLDFDYKNSLYSIPVRFGYKRAVDISRFCFIMMISLLTYIGWLSQRGQTYFVAVLLVSVILFYEHWLVRDIKKTGSSTKIQRAFFTVNGWVSVVFYFLVQLDFLLLG